jgi:hypothetical protein
MAGTRKVTELADGTAVLVANAGDDLHGREVTAGGVVIGYVRPLVDAPGRPARWVTTTADKRRMPHASGKQRDAVSPLVRMHERALAG